MKKTKISWLLSITVFSLLLLAIFSCSPKVNAVDIQNSSVVNGGVWLVNVQKFELSSGSYDLDFYLWFKWSGDPLKINYEFMNGRSSSIDVIKSEDGYLEVRVRGTFIKSLNFKDYPFDSHKLTIEIEDKSASLNELIFVPDYNESGIDPKINIAGWSIEDWSLESAEHNYPGDENFSRLVFSFTIGRSALSSVLKSIVPIMIITCIAMLAFLVAPSNYGQRISLGVTTLMAAVAYHLALTNQIPPIGYLTLTDKIMITAYGLFLYSLLVSVILMRLGDQKKLDEAIKLNRRTGLMVPVMAFVLMGLLLLLA